MDQMRLGLLVLLVLLVIVAYWYFYIREKKCTTDKDCQSNEACTSGVCKKAKGA